MTATTALAQESVLVRGGDHDDYSRLVFEWSSPVGYSVQSEGTKATITFKKTAISDFIGLPGDLRNAKNVGEVSEAGANLKISMTIPAGSSVRDLVIGNKIVLDIYDSKLPQKTAAKPEEKIQPAKKEEPKKAEGDFTLNPAEPAKPVPTVAVETQIIPQSTIEPHTITLTTLTSVGMAVYQRHGYLWMVLDQPDLQATPVLEGPAKEKFGTLEKTDLKDADLYKLELPDGISIKAEGGGLSWKITLSGKGQPERAGVSPVRESLGEGEGLLWPIPNLRKTISYDDPISGDVVNAITASNAAPSTGRARAFVDFQTFDGYAGLAFTSKRDGVKASVGSKGASLSHEAGLTLSSASDLQTQQIRKAAESETQEKKPEEPKKTEDNLALTEPPPEAQTAQEIKKEIPQDNVIVDTAQIAKSTQEKPTGNNIYNFSKWEMGGVRALQNNMHALMAEVAAKPPSEQTEDIITMAKLLLANSRATESLGMLRIAKQQLPELEGTPEFDSLLAAATALSGKYDEAIAIFARDDLQKFDDIKLWRAFTLAGLQDWKQAGSMMPANLMAVQSYPFNIRSVLTLAFAETALRNAMAPKARSLLEGMRPDLDKLSLADSSSWKYLAGETERQTGNAQKAKEYWEPLVNRGRDDLFRAKAGLSLTRLQIDQKTLKPEEAINRLEGLRYAWRGDELETLINYRLGQLYIENKEYLKGLTILRNASTMTPDLQIGQDVNTLMLNAFRDVFVKDQISTMSPIDAISFYEEFKDLTPPGEDSIQYVEKLSERLVEADLLGRAAALLEYQVNNRLQGAKKVDIAIRLAAIRLLDGNPDGALRSLDIAQNTIDKMTGVAPQVASQTPKPETPKPENIETQAGEVSKTDTAPKPQTVQAPQTPQTIDPEKQRQIYLLKARALSMKKKPDEALALLEGMRTDADVNRLRTDIAWVAGKWEEAAMALNDLILAEDISGRRPLTEYQQDIILNRAIALNLSGNRVALANLRERYVAQMKESAKGKMFEVVTRPRRPDMIGSREAIETMMSEIDLFKGFLDSYAKAQ